jgi:NADPH:quinone reductase-like Zn-dependent oxidoreductase
MFKVVGTAEERSDHLEHLGDLVRQGRYRPVIARVFPFEEAIEAHRYADGPGHGGSVVIKMKGSAENGGLYRSMGTAAWA